MRFLTRIMSTLAINIIKVHKTGFRNYAKALNQEHIVLNQETLTGRILLYLNTDKENQPRIGTEILNNFQHNVNNLHRLNKCDIINFSNSLLYQDLPKAKLVTILKELDTECILRLPELTTAEILKLLNVYMSITPNRITEYKFYKQSIKTLFNSFDKLNNKDLLQVIFYIGLKKKNNESQSMLRHCLNRMNKSLINDLTSEELCIICNSAFKTSTKIKNKHLLNKIRACIDNNLVLLKDCALLVTFVKSIRHNRLQDESLLNTISCATIFNKAFDSYSFSTNCHILALYADYFYFDEKLLSILVNKSLEQVNDSKFISKETYLTEQLRGKDIVRFVWVMSMFTELKLVSKANITDVIMPKLIERVRNGEFSNDPDSLIDIALYLWIMNYRPYELVPYIFNKKIVQAMGKKPKSNLRLNLLLNAINREDPALFKEISTGAPPTLPTTAISEYQLHKRPIIKRLLNVLEILMPKLDINRFGLTQEIPYLNIVGITGYQNNIKVVHIEVLDDYTRIRNVEEDIPVGLMSLKLRLLDRSEEGLLTVSQRDIEDMTDKELSDYLLDELKLIC